MNSFINKYEITCMIDKTNRLCGYLMLDEKTCVNFDLKDIYINDVALNISSSYMRVLERIILESPRIVPYDTLKEIFYDDHGDDGLAEDTDTRTQVLYNAKLLLSKYVNIKSKRNFGYFIELKKKIYKFNNIDYEFDNIRDIPELFFERGLIDTCAENTICEPDEILSFSRKFFHSGATEIADNNGTEVLQELSRLSLIFNPISNLDKRDANENFDVITDAYNCIVEGCRAQNVKEILKIRGPLGSYKSRIMQYLFLSVLKNNKDILPFFVDIALYEKMAESNPDITEEHIVEVFNNDIEFIKSAIASCKDKIPLLMIDGIRDFSRGEETLYYCIRKRLKQLKCKLVVCIDAEFTVNNQHQFKVHPLASNNFRHYMRITSFGLHKRKLGVDFIRNCIEISGVTLFDGYSFEQIYDNLVRLKFSSIDAYWLVYILKNHSVAFFEKSATLSDLFESICLNTLGSNRDVYSAAELAYDFEFGTVDFNKTNPLCDSRWQLIRMHRSILDYLIAKHYVRKIKSLTFDKSNREVTVRKLSFFNMVLQKSITRFVVDMIRGDDDCEYRIMVIAENYYDDLQLFGKSELTFWMARLKNTARKARCVQLLKEYNAREIDRYNKTNFKTESEKRNLAFLIRGISVSLIYEKDKETFKSYIMSLLRDKTANSVNRGFHLEYYGDKPYIANQTLLDFEDELAKGENTINTLCISLDKRSRRHDLTSFVAVLELITLCNLIQARCEAPENTPVLDIKPYISRTVKYLEWIVNHKALRGFNEVLHYFNWMHDELLNFEEDKSSRPVYSHASVYNKFSAAKTVSRTGWVNEGVAKPENIVEHMYNCWFIGMLYLPEKIEDKFYSKDKILKMLLIHDLAETQTGDIPRPEKIKMKRFYDREENVVMQSLLLSGTYPGAADINEYLDIWNEWEIHESENFKIAKDIDNIQTIYQFCLYYIENPDMFNEEKVCYWLSGIEDLLTDVGKDIAYKIVIDNPIFKEIVKQYEIAVSDL